METAGRPVSQVSCAGRPRPWCFMCFRRPSSNAPPRWRAPITATGTSMVCFRRRVACRAKLKIVTQGQWRKLQATTNIDAGDVILEERPLLTWKRGSAFETAQHAIAAFAKLPQGVQEQIRGYYSPPQVPPALSILQASFSQQDLRLLSMLEVCCSGTLPGSAALFHHVACANHSCRPNAVIRIRMTKEDSMLRIMALRSIASGNEICISYINEDLLLKPSNLRRAILRKSWGFSCNCPRCSEDDDTRRMPWTAWEEGLLWRKRMQLREEQEASEDARMRRFALGLGTPNQWKQRAQRLRKRQWLQKSVIFYQELLETFPSKSIKSSKSAVSSPQHWLLSAVARDASEAHLWRGELAEALEAAQLWRAFVEDVLGTTMSLDACLALEVEAAATEMQGHGSRDAARLLYQAALKEAEPLHNTWDENDFFVPYLRGRLETFHNT